MQTSIPWKTRISSAEKLILNNFSSAANQSLFTCAFQSRSNLVSSIGFFFSNSNYVISIASYLSCPVDDHTSADLLSMEVALQMASDCQIHVQHMFTFNQESLEILKHPGSLTHGVLTTKSPTCDFCSTCITSLPFIQYLVRG